MNDGPLGGDPPAPPGGSPSPLPPEGPDLWDRCAAWLQHHGGLPALGVLTLIMIVIYAHLFDGELVGDDLSFHMAESARIADCLRAGDFDLWNPSGNAGFASAYYYQVVPQLVSAIPAAVFGHHLFFFELSVFLPLVLAPAAAYRGMRLLGATPWQAVLAALAVGFINGESRWGTGNAGTFVVGLYTQTWAFAAFPLALGHAVRWVTETRSLAPALAWGSFVTLCHPLAGIALAGALLAGMIAQLVLRGCDAVLAELGQGIVRDPGTGAVPAAMAALGERWRNPPPRPWTGELARIAILGAGFAIAWMPIWLPLIVDSAGFGGFPHRVDDEVGPGFKTLFNWYASGSLLDFARPVVLTWSLPIAILFARARFMRWLWAPAVLYAALLALGPHIPKIGDDLIPPVRFLGSMQVVLALAIGAGALPIGARLWNAPEHSALARAGRLVILIAAAIGAAGLIYMMIWRLPDGSLPLVIGNRLTLDVLSQSHVRWLLLVALVVGAALGGRLVWGALGTRYGLHTGIAATAAALGVLLVLPGGHALASRVHVLDDYPGSHGPELRTIAWVLRFQPPGRKQVGKGAENHWWNLLSYEYGRRPALLMMGGGGLQASPSYDFLWSVRDFTKLAWVYDAPLLVFDRANTDKMPDGELVFSTKNVIVRRLPAPGLVSPVEVTSTLPPGRTAAHAAAIAWLKTDEPLADRVLAYSASSGSIGEPHGSVVRAFRQESPGDDADIYAEVDVAQPTTFMARESWHPRWRAYIDGAATPVRRVTPDFPAVDVPPGHHVIAFRFERPWWVHASWLAWPLVPLAAWRITRRGSRRRQPRQPRQPMMPATR